MYSYFSLFECNTGLQHGVISSSHPYGLPLDKVLMSEWFKKLGYNTHAVGKVSSVVIHAHSIF